MKNIVWTGLFLIVAAVSLHASDVPAEALREIAAANDGWLPALKHQDARAVADAYADDSIFVTSTGETVVGPAGVERLMKGRFAAVRVLDGALTQDGVRVEGSLIYEWGHADLQVEKHDGTKAASSGRYLTVWKRDPAGRWRIWRNLSL